MTPLPESAEPLMQSLPAGQRGNFLALRSLMEAASSPRPAPGGGHRLAPASAARDSGAGSPPIDLDAWSLRFVPAASRRALAQGAAVEIGTIDMRFLDDACGWVDLVCVARRGNHVATLALELADKAFGEADDDVVAGAEDRAALLLPLPPDDDGAQLADELRAAFKAGRVHAAVTEDGLGAFVLLWFELG